MTIKFYSSNKCPWAARVWLALIETHTPFELIEIDLSVPREPWYLEQINPAGKVPALQLEDGTVICESAICVEYLADITGKLLPRDPGDRSVLRFFVELLVTKFNPAMHASYGNASAKSREPLLAAIAMIEQQLRAHLRGGPFLLGSAEYTLAEVNCTPFLARFRLAGEHGILPADLYQRILKNSKFEYFNKYVQHCLKSQSHITIWDESTLLGAVRQRMEMSRKSSATDFIFVKELRLVGKVGLSAFSFADRSFPLTISTEVTTVPVEAGSDDFSVSYGEICRDITAVVEGGAFHRLEDLAAAIIETTRMQNAWRSLVVEKEGGVLRAEREVFEIDPAGNARSTITGIRVGCIIGVYTHEREKKQDVLINLSMLRKDWNASTKSELGSPLEVEDYKRTMIDAITIYIETSSFKTVEALAQKICELSLQVLPKTVHGVEVWMSKPSALVFAKHSGVSVTRMRENMRTES